MLYKFFLLIYFILTGWLGQLLIGEGGLVLDSRASQIGTVSSTARHLCDVSSELCCPGAKSQRYPLVTRLGVMPRV